MSQRTPSSLKETHIEKNEDEVQLDEWVKQLKKLFPTTPEHFIRTLARAYQLNPEKYNKIIEDDEPPRQREYDDPGSYNCVNVYSDKSEIPPVTDDTEFNAKGCFVCRKINSE